jgi:signal transduction histidine kinase
MAAGIAHEVRNPLTSLRGCAQELAEINRTAGNADAADLAAIMVSESDRLARIVEDFLTLSRLRPPNRETIDLEPVFADMRMLYERKHGDAAVPVTFRMDPDCPPVVGDPDQLRQIITNLVANSLDAVRKVDAPRVEVTASVAPDGALPLHAVAIQVTDNGSGIPVELQERVFTPFFSTKSQGTGLGLALVSRIVREHEGAVRIDSQPGMGTTISVYLPAHSQTRTFKRALGGS